MVYKAKLSSNLSISNTILDIDSNIKHCLLLLVFGIIMLLVRIIPIYSTVFTNWPGTYGNYVNFAADDAIYHMRFVHNTLHHFPWRVFFDPFTYFPFGSHIAFGPVFTIIIASVALIAGFGHPTPELVNYVAAYIPPVMAMLCLIPVYLITRQLFGKKIALLSAFILTFMPGEFLSRSTLGFVDHHVAEVLFSTITCTLLVYALNTKKIFYGLLAGISFGLFILVWQGALMFGAIFLVFFITQLIVDHIKNNNTSNLFFLASLIYIPPTIMVWPYTIVVPMTLYPSNNILILTAMFAIFTACYLLHLAIRRSQLTKKIFPLALIALFIITAIILKKSLPHIYNLIYHGCTLLFQPTPGMKTISEVHPAIIGYDGKITLKLFWNNLFWTLPLAIAGIGCLGYRIYKNKKSADIFLLIWTLIIIVAACAQIRFNYYLAVNAAILAGLACYSLKTWKLFFVAILLLITTPMLYLLIYSSIPSGFRITQEWHSTLLWLKNHTPNPQDILIDKNFDFIAGYYPIPKDSSSYYNYPKTAYGVMSWWDFGHQITNVAERIPNASPFQQGVIEKDGTGAATFFTNTDEALAIRNLDKLGSRYIITTMDTANEKFPSIAIWANNTNDWHIIKNIAVKLPKVTISFQAPFDSPKFFQAMMGNLHYNDANGLQHLRLIHESGGNYHAIIKRAQLNQQPINTMKFDSFMSSFASYDDALKTVRLINQGLFNEEKKMFLYSSRPPAKSIKIFEKVKGAVIHGRVLNNVIRNTTITLLLTLKTKYDRTFVYQQTAKINNHGTYKFIVPYPTTKMHSNNYSYDIEPIGNYQIKLNNQTIEVFVPENAVMLGQTIKVPNLK